ncbi:Transcriptional regulatory protein SDS3 [Nakaseomyces bracarensis]|uniref:Transcriptional regulatory protein SDS3 n=1 Tax=Nakaseomyces bracarensis TaxID=273131 RepID=A0ABR4NN09_9SACH
MDDVETRLANDVPRKDKRRVNLENKVSKIQHGFVAERDSYYRDRLTSLQTDLTSLHQGNNELFLRRLRDLEEMRDLELVRLRLYEEYRVYRSGIEFQEEIEKTKEDHERMVKICKERLYQNVEMKIKRLQEERLLMDVANIHTYSMDYDRPHYQKNTRSHTANGWESSSNDFGKETANESATDTGLSGFGNERRSLRRRVVLGREGSGAVDGMNGGNATSGYTSGGLNGDGYNYGKSYNTEDSDGGRYTNGYASTSGRTGKGNQNSSGYKTDLNSDSEFLQSIGDGAELYNLLFGDKNTGKKDGKEGKSDKKKPRGAQRYSMKTAPPLQSLKTEEVTEDIALIRELTGQPPAPFRVDK